jgi:two-component system, NarL family, nitrate/nitrite response regulator NarL
MVSQIRVAILDNHQSIIDGYAYRLKQDPSIQIVATAFFGDELEPIIASQAVDVLLMGLSVPNSAENHTPFPALYIIPHLLKIQPDLKILVVSMLRRQVLIRSLLEVGIRGYILKEDQASIQQLARIVGMVADGGIYFSKNAHHYFPGEPDEVMLSRRQVEALSLCAASPEDDTVSLAKRLGYAESTLRNLLSAAYRRLGVRTRAGAVAKAQQLGILPTLMDGLDPATV